jgi:eukaryotic-like serine/threonine-protein kinase
MALETPMQQTPQSVGLYDLTEKIAEGGMGTVYKARHRETGDVVAVKLVPPHLASNTVLLRRFEQEFRAAKQIDHPNVVKAIDYGQSENGTPYLVMEFVNGESIGQRLERDGKIPETEAIRLIAQAAQGLYRAHKNNLIHRDVKPDNIMVTVDGQAKLADLGLVKETESDLNLTRTGRGLGTPHFMAPEQFRNAKNADVRCDIYSLGATLYMMVTGELPFKSCGPLDAWMKKMNNEIKPPRELVPGLSERLDWAIMRAMHAESNVRPSSCREFVEDLQGASTRKVPKVEGQALSQDVWFLYYIDQGDATAHTVKGSKKGIRQSIKEGRLGDASTVRASRNKEGPFEPLRNFPEFRDLVIEVGQKPPKNDPAASPPAAANRAAPAPAKPNAKAPPKEPDVTPAPRAVSPPTKLDTTDEPHFPMPTGRPTNFEWVKWVILLILAVLVAVTTYLTLFDR